ncbi:MAG: hypothetical protein GY829_15790 [Gammaproteobacteria bacterium]|nr:hypothetical protein [Gammaproteobacteria bacterium]
MNDKQNVEQYRQLLDQSCRDMPGSVNAQLDEKRRLAVELLDTGHVFSFTKWQPVLTLSISLFVIIIILYLPIPSQQQTVPDIYADLELLMDEDQLDFLSEMELSEWLVSANEG